MRDYQDNLNRIALLGVNKPVYYPEPNLAIAQAENLAPMPILTTRIARPKERLYAQTNTNSYSGITGHGPISPGTQDTKDYYLGEGVEY